MVHSSPEALSSHIALAFNPSFPWKHYFNQKVLLSRCKIQAEKINLTWCLALPDIPSGGTQAPVYTHIALGLLHVGETGCPQARSARMGAVVWAAEAGKGCTKGYLSGTLKPGQSLFKIKSKERAVSDPK